MSTSARRIKLRVAPPRPRNPVAPLAAQRKAGQHRKSHSAERQAGKRALKKELGRM